VATKVSTKEEEIIVQKQHTNAMEKLLIQNDKRATNLEEENLELKKQANQHGAAIVQQGAALNRVVLPTLAAHGKAIGAHGKAIGTLEDGQAAQGKAIGTLQDGYAAHDGQIGDLQHDVKGTKAHLQVTHGMARETKELATEANDKADYLREGQNEIRDKQEEQDVTMEFHTEALQDQQSAMKSTQKVVASVIKLMHSGEGKDKVKKQAKAAGIRVSDASDASGGFGSELVNDVVSPPASKRPKVEEEGLKPAAKERNSTEGGSKVVSFGDRDANDVVVADQDEQDESKQEREDDNNGSTNDSTNASTNDSSDSNWKNCFFVNPDAL